MFFTSADINECEEGTHVCNIATEICLNEPGGYRCGKKNNTSTLSQCQTGLKYNAASKTCVGKFIILSYL